MREKFSDEEAQLINESYWQEEATAFEHRGKVTCPRCRGPVTVLVSQEIRAPYWMRAHCDRCGASASFRSADEKGERLSEDELQAAVHLHQAERTPRCPRDNTPLRTREIRALGGGLVYKLDCPRCGASGQLRAH